MMINSGQQWSTLINNDQQRSAMINDNQQWSTIINNDQWLSTMINNDQQWSTTINNDQWWSTMINNDQQWSTMINNDQRWSTMDKKVVWKRFSPPVFSGNQGVTKGISKALAKLLHIRSHWDHLLYINNISDDYDPMIVFFLTADDDKWRL